MKKLFAAIALVAIAMLGASEAGAQKYGVTVGANFTSMQSIEKSSATGFSVGATSQFKLPLGFSLQPSLIYSAKVSEVGQTPIGAMKMNVGYLELPVSVQWGPDLLLFRPFLDITPYIGCAVNSNLKVNFDDMYADGLGAIKDNLNETLSDEFNDVVNKLEYGLGLGAGVEVWRFQLICRYNWNFGPLLGADKEVSEYIKDSVENKNFGGVTLSLAFLFGK